MASLSLFTFTHWRRKWQPTPVFLPGESQGRGSLAGCRLWGRTESDTTEVTQQLQQHVCGCVLTFTSTKKTFVIFVIVLTFSFMAIVFLKLLLINKCFPRIFLCLPFNCASFFYQQIHLLQHANMLCKCLDFSLPSEPACLGILFNYILWQVVVPQKHDF